jgi:hypothetical protein
VGTTDFAAELATDSTLGIVDLSNVFLGISEELNVRDCKL